MKALLFSMALAVFAAPLHAQSPSAPEGKGKMREALKEARKACEGKPAAERRECMRRETCAKAPDPAQCEARAKEHAQRSQQRLDERQKAHEACTGKRGEELRACLGEQRPKKPAPKS